MTPSIIADYPALFDTTNCPNGSLMHLGLQVGEGWQLVIGRMCAQLQPLAEGGGVQILAVKQDMGTLRVAYRGGDDAIEAVIAAAKLIAARTCECCGAKGGLQDVGGWWSVTCAVCQHQS
jgi:hypothetical protein